MNIFQQQRQNAYERAQKAYDAVPEHIRDDILEAITWAKATLEKHEGEGHSFYISAAKEPGLVVCSFSKPEWASDHCSQGMEHGAEAIVMAVCEYLNGA